MSWLVRAVSRWCRTHARQLVLARAREAGYAAVMVAIIVPTVGIGCAAVAVDVGGWYARIELAQKAADAAALGGVPYLPQDFANAKVRALEIAARNGFDNDATDSTSHAGNTVTVGLGDKATQLKVTIRSTVTNQFGSMIGISKQTITKSSVADYQGPAPMGSPCNTFGNEPNAGNRAVVSPTGTANGGTSGCSRTPQFWATVEGPQTDKVYGDRYQTKTCADGTDVDGCGSDKDNDEYDPFGYVFIVKVGAAAVGTTIDLQLYDPGFAYTGLDCNLLPPATNFPVDTTTRQNTAVNPYVTNKDAVNRYSDDGAYSGDKFSNYCTGDFYPPGNTYNPMTTSFALRQQTDTQNPKVATVQKDTSGNACIKQYGTWLSTASGNNVSSAQLTSTSSSYMGDEVAAQFHNWSSFCKFTPATAGDYYLQVRTNVSMSGTGGTYIKSGNTNVLAATGNTSTGNGDNSFAARAVTASGKQSSVAVSGYNHMPIYVNADTAAPNFYLIRVLPGAAGQKISFSYFDIGDAEGTGSVAVKIPPDATGTITSTAFPGGCTAYGGSAGGSQASQTTLNNCTAPFSKTGSRSTDPSKNNGKTETITIPIPNDYTCDYNSQTGCWYRVAITFGSGAVNDITTWDATVVGDPVRLVE